MNSDRPDDTAPPGGGAAAAWRQAQERLSENPAAADDDLDQNAAIRRQEQSDRGQQYQSLARWAAKYRPVPGERPDDPDAPDPVPDPVHAWRASGLPELDGLPRGAYVYGLGRWSTLDGLLRAQSEANSGPGRFEDLGPEWPLATLASPELYRDEQFSALLVLGIAVGGKWIAYTLRGGPPGPPPQPAAAQEGDER